MLNKYGWGLREMLILSGILALFLIIAIYYISTLYEEIDKDVTSNYYYDLENDLENSAKVYLNDYYDGVLNSEGVTITRSILRTYGLDVTLVDDDNNVCSGYVVASKSHGKENIDAFISCPDYTTDGYEEWRN